MKKILATLHGNDIAPRFDLAPEALIVSVSPNRELVDSKTVVLPRPSAETLCRLAASENVQTVISGGIEEEYLRYFAWKRIEVIDSIIGSAECAVENVRKGNLKPGDILVERRRA